MAHPAEPGSKAPSPFSTGRLTPDEADRLAATFRPSWELDDAPFTGPGVLSEADLRALQGGGTHADVRATVQAGAHASNGTHAVPVPATSGEPENSVIIDRSITSQDIAAPAQPRSAPPKPGATMLGMAPPPPPQAIPQPVAPAPAPPPPPVASRPPPRSQRPQAPQFHVGPPTPPKARPAVSVDLDVSYPKKPKTGLWLGLGAGGVAVLGLVVWLVSSSGSSEKAAPPPTETHAAEDKLSTIPPPPPVTAAATAATTAAPPPAATTAAPVPTPAPAPIPTTPVAALPQAAPVPTHAPAAAPRANYGAPAPRPAGRPKGGQTIVRDVPF